MADPKKTEKPAPLAAVAKRYQAAYPHAAAEIAAYEPGAAAEGADPVALFRHSLMDSMVQLEAAGKAKMMGQDVVVERQRVLVAMLAEVTPAPAAKK